jgi:hypothetical protein
MTNTIWKFVKTGRGFKERLVIKGFKSSEAMYKFTQSPSQGNVWEYCDGPNARHSKFKGMKAGTYAFAGGKFHNVKSLDASTLAHI